VWRNKQSHARVCRLLLAGILIVLTACSAFTTQRLSADEAFSATPIPGMLYVDPSLQLGKISPYILGTNYGPWNVVPLDLMPLAQNAGFTFLRFPGGDWGDENDLTDLQIDNFIGLATSLGAEPSISVRLPGGSPEAAADLVRYVNIEKGYTVRYWSIGNEPQYYEGYTTARYNQEWREIALAMQTADPDILLIGPEITQYLGDPSMDPRDSEGKLWMDEFLKANGDLVDIVSIHRYPFPISLNSGPAQIEDLRANVEEWDQILPKLKEIILLYTGRVLPVAVTEFNSHWNSMTGGEATPDSHFNAIWLSEVLAKMIRHQVEIVAQFAIQSSSDNGGWGIFSRVDPRPSYYVYRLFSLLGNQLVSSDSGIPDVSITAAQREDGKLTLLIINLRSEEIQVPLSWKGKADTSAEYWLFDATHAAEQMDVLQLHNGGFVSLPAESISVFIF
jgi:hypothetical protein